jgi:hypothetical protein
MLLHWSNESEADTDAAILAARAIYDRVRDRRLHPDALKLIGWVIGNKLYAGDSGALVPDDVWVYPTALAAVDALNAWDPMKTSDPPGWVFHPGTSRHRIGGDPKREFMA